jgi:hypothetical protein
MHIIDDIADRWGSTLLPKAGKTVWFELALPSAPRDERDGAAGTLHQ